jgi:hypothetical protein
METLQGRRAACEKQKSCDQLQCVYVHVYMCVTGETIFLVPNRSISFCCFLSFLSPSPGFNFF